MHRTTLRLLAVAVTALAVVATAAPESYAAAASPSATSTPPPNLYGLRPVGAGLTNLQEGHFAFALPAGSRARDGVDVINESGGSLIINLYPANVTQLAGGTNAISTPGASPTGPTTWLRLARATVTVPPNGHIVDAITVAIPRGTPPGQYLTSVVGALAGSRTVASGVTVHPRVALLCIITVLGKLKAGLAAGMLTTQDFPGGRRVSVTVTNTGNVLETLSGTLSVHAGSSTTTVDLAPTGINVIPGGTLTLTADAPPAPAFGSVTYDADVVATVDDKAVASVHPTPLTLSNVPWAPLGGAAALLLGVAGVAMATRGPRARRRAARAEERSVLEAYRASKQA